MVHYEVVWPGGDLLGIYPTYAAALQRARVIRISKENFERGVLEGSIPGSWFDEVSEVKTDGQC